MTHRRTAILSALAALLGGCDDDRHKSEPAPMPSTPPAPSTEARLDELRRLMQASTTRGGHGPLPQRSVNADGIDAVGRALRPGDPPLLVDLLGDDDALVRLMATHLLARHDPTAAERVRAAVAQAPAGVRKQRLQDALIEIELPRAPLRN